jgi:hypothetical protein
MKFKGGVQSNKKRIPIAVTLLLISTWVIGCHQEIISSRERSSLVGTSTSERALNPAFKGMELYSWQEESGQWYYSILIGTNRAKSLDEIQIKPIGINEVKVIISRMAVGESVFWFNQTYNSKGGQHVDLAFPSEGVIEDLKLHAMAHQVLLYLPDE